jgi:hypothetical protein
MNYDQWKTEVPPDIPDNNCNYCGEPCEKEFCNKECYKAYVADN